MRAYVALIVVAMESDNLFNERQSIRDSARQLKKYGSTCNHVRNNEYLIRHNLQQTDTLQGIALKYGCTVCINCAYNCHWKLCTLYYAMALTQLKQIAVLGHMTTNHLKQLKRDTLFLLHIVLYYFFFVSFLFFALLFLLLPSP